MSARAMARRMKRPIRNGYFESLFNKVPEAIALCDNRGHVIKVNAEFRRMFGFSQAEVTGRLIDELIAPTDLRDSADILTQAVAKGQQVSAEAVRLHRDGTPLDVSILGAPILVHGRQVAVYGIYRDISAQKAAERALLDSRREVLEANAALQQRTRALETANEQLERLSNLDGLTGIPNRRYFEAFYGIEWRRACRAHRWISLIMADVDFFKAYNDTHGHLAGDECLKRIAQALAEEHRAGDLVARYGGEEFVALLADIPPEGALHAAERMRRRVKELALPHGHSAAAPVVTVSLGVASQRAEGTADPMALLRRADEALYRAKSGGRNCVASAED